MYEFRKPLACTHWTPESSQWLREASFLSIEPVGFVYDENGTACDVVCAALDAHSWSILANFPLKPYWEAAKFRARWRHHAFHTLLKWKHARPLFFQEPGETIELHGDSVSDVLEEIRSKGVLLEEEDLVES